MEDVMKLTKENRRYWAEAFIDEFCESKRRVFEIGKLGYPSAESARHAYNNYIQKSRKKVAVFVRKGRVFLIKL